MRTILKVSLLTPAAVLMFVVDVPPQLPAPYVQLVPEAQAILGVRRRSFRRGVVVGASVGAAEASSAQHSQQAATAQQQSATAQQQSATAQQQSATAQQQTAIAQQEAATAQQMGRAAPPPPPAAGGKPLPLGTVVPSLPGGCTSTPVGGVEYYYCGGNFYRAVFQGNNLVYVTAQPK
jgi:hypothetical protein